MISNLIDNLLRVFSHRNKVALTLFCVVLTGQIIAQQMPVLTHYYYNPYLINPAMAGSASETRACVFYRHQWIGIPGAPETQAFTIDGPLDERPIGLGLSINNDISNVIGRLSAMLSGSYVVKFSDVQQLRFGMSLGILRNEIKFDKIRADLNDPSLLQNAENRTTLEGSAGLSYKLHKLQIGVVSEQLFNQSIEYENATDGRTISFAMVRHYLLSVQYPIQLNTNFELTPLVVFRNAQGLPAQVDANATLKFKDLAWTNLAYRHKSGVGISLGTLVSDRFIVAYNYEIPTTDLRYTTSGSHEFMIGMRLINRGQKPSSSRAANARVIDEFKKDTHAQYEKLDEIQQKNETLNQQLLEYKKIIEQQTSEIAKLKSSINSVDDELRSTVERLKVDLQTEASFDKSSVYYLVIGAFKSLSDAKSFQKIVRRETNLKPDIIQSETQTWYFVYSDQLKSPSEAREKIKALDNTNIKPFIIGNPWVYKTKKN